MPGSSHETCWMTRPLEWTQKHTGRHTGRRSALARIVRDVIGLVEQGYRCTEDGTGWNPASREGLGGELGPLRPITSIINHDSCIAAWPAQHCMSRAAFERGAGD
jgi:hypothetical protein